LDEHIGFLRRDLACLEHIEAQPQRDPDDVQLVEFRKTRVFDDHFADQQSGCIAPYIYRRKFQILRLKDNITDYQRAAPSQKVSGH
jgi:hypothetical protein